MTIGKPRGKEAPHSVNGWGQTSELHFIARVGTAAHVPVDHMVRFQSMTHRERSLRRVVILSGYLMALQNRAVWWPRARVYELESAALSAIQDEADRWDIDVEKLNGREPSAVLEGV